VTKTVFLDLKVV